MTRLLIYDGVDKSMNINIFIQARMSSSRFPGKVLAPFRGKPILLHLIERSSLVSNISKVVVLTSNSHSDDPVAAYLESEGISYFRGDLNNVFKRFQDCLEKYPCDYFIRLCADSPLLSPELLSSVIKQMLTEDSDLVTNIYKRTFPKGQSFEIIKTDVFKNVHSKNLTPDEQEHVMPYFYNQIKSMKTISVESSHDSHNEDMAIDTIEDLKRLESSNTTYSFHLDSLCLRHV